MGALDSVNVLPGAASRELLLVGDGPDVERSLALLRGELDPNGIAFTVQDLTDVAAGVTAVASVAANSGKVLRLTDESAALVGELGAIEDGAGNFHTFVREGGRIKAQLRFTSTSVKPQQLASLQTAAATLALRAAIQGVQDAVVRVEGKVDEVLRLAKAERVGDILGQRATLSNVRALAEQGPLSDADWASVAGLVTPIQSAVEALRRYVIASVAALPVDEGPGERRAGLAHLVGNGQLGEALALLQIAESNMFMWQEIRLHRVQHEEPDHLDAVLHSAHGLIEANRLADEALMRHLGKTLEDYARIDAFEVPWKVHAKGLRTNLNLAQAELFAFAASQGIEGQAIVTRENATIADTAREARELAAAASGAILWQGRQAGQILVGKASRARDAAREAVRGRTERRNLPRLFANPEKDG